MKSLITFVLCCLCYSGFANPVFDKLAEVNKCWKEQNDAIYPAASFGVRTERDWIKLHLQQVEQTLRVRDMNGLSAFQQANRQRSLDNLHQYWMAGNFPVNDQYACRTPIFIDRYNNFCAVGYLIKASGNESISRMIAAKTNLAYVRDMNYPELGEWAKENGFTIDELAWIQPGYAPTGVAQSIGKGTDGEIHELYADDAAGILYVGGSFNNVDSTIAASNITYVTESGGVYTWHSMGAGVNGPVYAITKFNNRIYVAGSFSEAGGVPATNVAYWDGSAWHSSGCTYGVVRDLAVFNNELYACGRFDVCAALAEVNFAKYNSTFDMWQQMPELIGNVNTMEVVDTSIVLGGHFMRFNDTLNVIAWSPAGSFQPYNNKIVNEVRDIQFFKDTLYAACKRINASDSNLLMKNVNGTWLPAFSFPTVGSTSFNTLCAHSTSLRIGGLFNYLPMMGMSASNYWAVLPPTIGTHSYFDVNGEVNKIVLFKGDAIVAGKFTQGGTWPVVTLNHIARQNLTTSVKSLQAADLSFNIYPNPVLTGGQVTITNGFNARQMTITDVNGHLVFERALSKETESLTLPAMAAGAYLVELKAANGERATKKVIVK